jgi:drug/metabolite transporter (DMT)-like permease
MFGNISPETVMNNLALYVTAVLVWGSTWLVINYQLGVVPPGVSVVYRYAIAATLLFAWAALRGLRLRFGWRAHLRFFLLGLLLFSFNYIAAYSAQQYITSALNAVAFSTMMWMNVINARLFFGTRIEPRLWLGAALGMAGVVTLFWPQISVISLSDTVLLGACLSLGGALLASLGNMVSKRAQEEGLPIIQSNAWGMLYGTLITALVALWQGSPFVFEWTFSYLSSLLYLAVFGSVVAFGAYLKLVGRIGPHKAGYAVVMFPVVAVVLSTLFEGLALEPHLLGGVGLVLAGNLVILGFWKRGPQLRHWLRQQHRYWFDRKQLASPGPANLAGCMDEVPLHRS